MSKQILRAAVIQMTAGPDIADNAQLVEGWIRQAAAGGAQLIVTPENTCHMLARMAEKLETVPDAAHHPMLQMAARVSHELKVHILLGSVSVRGTSDKLSNRSYLYRAGHVDPVMYDKLHLFDADLAAGQSYRESEVFCHGARAVVANIDQIKLGLSICYDVRFPSLYRALAKAGAQVISVPAAFAVPTGEAHWHVLLRARAIENGVYILAPAQVGEHAGGRRTYGHSMIIDPWGRVITEMHEPRAGILYADLDMGVVTRCRESVASLKHDQPIVVEQYD